MFRTKEKVSRLVVCAGILSTFGSLVVPAIAHAADNPKGIPTSAEAFVVVEVDDGDSFFVATDDGEKQQVDLLGIDAPELKNSGDECFAREAADALASLIPADSTVYLEDEDVDDEDHAWLRDVWVEGKDGGKAALLNTKLVREGFAGSDLDDDEEGKYSDRISDAEDNAKDAKRGLWGACGGVHKKIVPTPTPTPSVEEIKAQYVPLADVREMAIRPGGMMGQKLYFYGTIRTIEVATPGYAFTLGDQDPQQYAVGIQVEVVAPDGTTEYVSIGFDGDTSGMYEGTYVLVYGTLVDTRSGTNALGGTISQPLVAAQYVEFA
jgi:endonuclease YncB( thermonuclease family)